MNKHYRNFCNRYNLNPDDISSARLWEESLPTYTEEEVEWARISGCHPDHMATPLDAILQGGAIISIIITLMAASA